MSHEEALPYLRPEHKQQHEEYMRDMAAQQQAAEQLLTAEPMTALDKLNALPLNEFDRNAAISDIRNLVVDGEINAVEFAIKLAALEKFIKELRADKSIKEVVAKDAKGWKGEALYGHTISVSLRREWAYSDSELAKMEEEAKALDLRIKKRQEMLQTLTAEVADPSTGEMIKPATVEKLSEIVTVKEVK